MARTIHQEFASLVIHEALPRKKRIGRWPVAAPDLWVIAALKMGGLISHREVRSMLDYAESRT